MSRPCAPCCGEPHGRDGKMQSRPNKKMDLAGAEAAGRVQVADVVFCNKKHKVSLHTLCTPGADACGEGEEQRIDPTSYSWRFGRIRDEYAHAVSLAELLGRSVTWNPGTPHTASVFAPWASISAALMSDRAPGIRASRPRGSCRWSVRWHAAPSERCRSLQMTRRSGDSDALRLLDAGSVAHVGERPQHGHRLRRAESHVPAGGVVLALAAYGRGGRP